MFVPSLSLFVFRQSDVALRFHFVESPRNVIFSPIIGLLAHLLTSPGHRVARSVDCMYARDSSHVVIDRSLEYRSVSSLTTFSHHSSSMIVQLAWELRSGMLHASLGVYVVLVYVIGSHSSSISSRCHRRHLHHRRATNGRTLVSTRSTSRDLVLSFTGFYRPRDFRTFNFISLRRDILLCTVLPCFSSFIFNWFLSSVR